MATARIAGLSAMIALARRGRRDDKWRVVTFIRGLQIGWTEKKPQVPPLRFGGDDNFV
jgi:hypothetical protein